MKQVSSRCLEGYCCIIQKIPGWGWNDVRGWGGKGMQTEVMLAGIGGQVEGDKGDVMGLQLELWLIRGEEKVPEIGVGRARSGLRKWVEKGGKSREDCQVGREEREGRASSSTVFLPSYPGDRQAP